jgi:hypothetical protein
MTKKKAKSKAAPKTKSGKSTRKSKKELNPAEVRKDISRMVESHAATMAQAVIGQGEMGQLATVKYLFEMAEIFPASTDGSHATADEDCLARTLLDRLDLPTEPVGRDEEDEPTKRVNAPPGPGAPENPGEKKPNKPQDEQKGFERQADNGDSLDGGTVANDTVK